MSAQGYFADSDHEFINRLIVLLCRASWVRHDDIVWPIEPTKRLYQWVEKLPQFLARSEIL